jgi:hypothetical protein
MWRYQEYYGLDETIQALTAFFCPNPARSAGFAATSS